MWTSASVESRRRIHEAAQTEADMTDTDSGRSRRGRDVTIDAILDAAEELFAARGYAGVTVREIGERAGVSHALVHQYVGSKADILRDILTRNEGVLVSDAPDDAELLESADRILRRVLAPSGRIHARLLMRSALDGVPYDRTTGRFEAVERLVALAERTAASATNTERAGTDLDPRFVVACVGSLVLGWISDESWMRPAAGIEGMDDAAVLDGLERVVLGILKDHVPGAARADERVGPE
jgi:TetR/AcrR family transcriptional regulator, repressor for neighboring sulfatase